MNFDSVENARDVLALTTHTVMGKAVELKVRDKVNLRINCICAYIEPRTFLKTFLYIYDAWLAGAMFLATNC